MDQNCEYCEKELSSFELPVKFRVLNELDRNNFESETDYYKAQTVHMIKTGEKSEVRTRICNSCFKALQNSPKLLRDDENYVYDTGNYIIPIKEVILDMVGAGFEGKEYQFKFNG